MAEYCDLIFTSIVLLLGCGLNKKHARRKAAHNCIILLSKTKGDLRCEVQSLGLSQIPCDVVSKDSDIGKLKNITA